MYSLKLDFRAGVAGVCVDGGAGGKEHKQGQEEMIRYLAQKVPL